MSAFAGGTFVGKGTQAGREEGAAVGVKGWLKKGGCIVEGGVKGDVNTCGWITEEKGVVEDRVGGRIEGIVGDIIEGRVEGRVLEGGVVKDRVVEG